MNIPLDVIEHVLPQYLTNKSLLSLACVGSEYHDITKDKLIERNKQHRCAVEREKVKKIFKQSLLFIDPSILPMYSDYTVVGTLPSAYKPPTDHKFILRFLTLKHIKKTSKALKSVHIFMVNKSKFIFSSVKSEDYLYHMTRNTISKMDVAFTKICEYPINELREQDVNLYQSIMYLHNLFF